MSRHRQRLTLDGGPKLDLARLIPKGSSRPGAVIRSTLTYASGLVVRVEIRLDDYGGTLEVTSGGPTQTFTLTAKERHFGRSAVLRDLPQNLEESAGALQAWRGALLCQPPCLGPESRLCLAVPGSGGTCLADKGQGEEPPDRG